MTRHARRPGDRAGGGAGLASTMGGQLLLIGAILLTMTLLLITSITVQVGNLSLTEARSRGSEFSEEYLMIREAFGRGVNVSANAHYDEGKNPTTSIQFAFRENADQMASLAASHGFVFSVKLEGSIEGLAPTYYAFRANMTVIGRADSAREIVLFYVSFS